MMDYNLSSRKLKPSTEKLKTLDIYGFDIETYGRENKFLMGSIVNDKKEYVFWDKERMQTFVKGSNLLRGSTLFATNLAFDFLGLFDDLSKLHDFSYVVKGSEFMMITHRNKKHVVKFMDTMSFFRASVNTLGKIVGEPKLEKPDFLGQHVGMNTDKGRQLQEYNIRDSRISYLFAKFLQDNFNDLGANMRCTIASTSMGLFKRKYLKNWIIQPQKELLKEQFQGYFGGRVEAFYRGKVPSETYLYDINSLYPYVMSTKSFPNPNTLREGIDLEKEGMTYARIKVPDSLSIPLLPFRGENKLLFPGGEFQSWQSNVELRKAIEIGYDIHPIKGYHYEKTFNPFRSYITDLYAKRRKYKKEKSPIELVMKLCMNSLYGKFGQKMYQQEMIFPNDKEGMKKFRQYCQANRDLLDEGKPARYSIDSPDTVEKLPDGTEVHVPKIFYIKDEDTEDYPPFINPILCIYTTSHARLELYKWIEKIQAAKKRVFYCDTDSVITDHQLPTGKRLGQMKLELNIKKGIIIKPKFYYLEDDSTTLVKAKGMMNLKTLSQFNKIVESRVYKYKKFTRFRESIRRNLAFNQILDVEKIVGLEDDKRKWKKEKFDPSHLESSEPVKISILP